MEVFKLFGSIFINTDDAEKSLAKTEQSGQSLGDKLSGVFGGIGTAAAGIATAVGGAAVSAGKTLYDFAAGAGAAGDAIDKQSQKLGLSTQGYQEWSHVLKLTGGDIDSLGVGMKTLTQNLAGAGEDSAKAKKAFEAVGLSLDDVKNKSPEETFNMVITALQGMPEGAEKTAASLALLGKQGMALGPLLNSSAEATAGMKQEAHDLGLVMSDQAVKAGDTFAGSMINLQGAFSGVKNSIGAAMLPGINSVIQGFTGLVTGSAGASDQIKKGAESLVTSVTEQLPRMIGMFSGIVDGIAPIVPQIFETLVNGIVDNLPTLADSAGKIITAIGDAIGGALPVLTGAAVQILLMIVNGITDNIGQFADTGISVVTTLVNGISGALPQLIPAAVRAVMSIAEALIDNLPALLDAGLQLLLGLVQGIINAIPELIKELPKVIDGIVNFLAEAIPSIIDAGIQLLESLVAALPEIIDAIVKVLPQIIDGIINGIIRAIPQLIQAGISLITAIITDLPTIITTIISKLPEIILGIIDALVSHIPELIDAGIQLLVAIVTDVPAIIEGIVKAIPRIITAVVNAFIEYVPKMADTGLKLIQGLWQGISDAAAWLRDKISGFFGGVVDSIKNFFGIHSPSKLFADDIGANLVAGLAKGIDENAEKAAKSARDMMEGVLDAAGDIDVGLNAAVNVKGQATGQAAAPSGDTYNMDIHVDLSTFEDLIRMRDLLTGLPQALRVQAG